MLTESSYSAVDTLIFLRAYFTLKSPSLNMAHSLSMQCLCFYFIYTYIHKYTSEIFH